jgi:type IV secretion system protein VirB11
MALDPIMLQRELQLIINSLKPIAHLFNDPLLTDVFCSTQGNISTKAFGRAVRDEPITLSVEQRNAILKQIAQHMEITIDYTNYPVLEGTIPIPDWKSRITGIFPPFVDEPSFAIRRPPQRIYTLEEYVHNNQLSSEKYDLIISHIKSKKNIIISGSTGSGKTTFINAIIKKKAEFFPADRFYIIQDNNELQCDAKYTDMILIRREQAVRAVQLSLRYSPDSIIFGEVRDGIVMNELLDAWNTGHPGGITSIHANSSASTITRIETLLRQKYAGSLPDIHEMVDLIVHLKRNPATGMKVTEVMQVKNQIKPMIEGILERAEAIIEN